MHKSVFVCVYCILMHAFTRFRHVYYFQTLFQIFHFLSLSISHSLSLPPGYNVRLSRLSLAPTGFSRLDVAQLILASLLYPSKLHQCLVNYTVNHRIEVSEWIQRFPYFLLFVNRTLVRVDNYLFITFNISFLSPL